MEVKTTYQELTFQQLMDRPAWKFRRTYEYLHPLRMKYNDIFLSRIFIN
jgi:hypothetical protein